MRPHTLHLLLLCACAHEVPLDEEADATLNVVEGTVIFLGEGDPADTFVLVFDAADPPPPAGTGSPVTFAAVPAEAFSIGTTGAPAAPFSVTHLPDGDYLLAAINDQDADFQPLLSTNAGATCGDVAGAHLADLSTGERGVVSVAGGQRVGGLPIFLGSVLPTERPAFVFTDNTAARSTDPTQLTFGIASTGIYSELVTLTGPFDGTAACDTMFYVHVVDADGDGAPDPHPNPSLAAAGMVDIWPRLYLQFLGSEQTPLTEGESYATEAAVYPTFLSDGSVPVGVPTPLTSLTGLFLPGAIHTLPDGSEAVVQGADVPAGPWSLTVVSLTGQTWTLPNEAAAFGSTDASFEPAAQGAALTVE